MDLSTFTNEASDVSFEKYNVDSTVGAKVLGYPIAIATDIGTSIWNSLTPEKYNISTEDALGKINENALNIYNENEDTVKLLSFVGGLVLPQGIALKGMKYLRSGVKGANWFSEAGQVARLGEIKSVYENSGRVSDLARGLVWENRFAAAGNALVDASVLEGTMLLTMNAHPYMEDYIKDPWKNAGIGIMFGTGLMGLGNIAVANKTMSLKAAEVATESNTAVREISQAIDPTLNLSGQLAVHADNVANWENALATKTDTLTEHTKELLKFNILSSKATQSKIFDSMLAEGIKEGEDWKAIHAGRFAQQPERFAGVDHISFPTVPDIVEINSAQNAKKLFDSTTLKGEKIPLVVETEEGSILKTVLYSPVLDRFMTRGDLRFYGTAADLGLHTEKALMSGIKDIAHTRPNFDIGLESLSSSGSTLDANFLRGLSYFSTRPLTDFKNAVIASDDFGMLQGLSTRLQTEVFSGILPADFKIGLAATHSGVVRNVNPEQLYEYLQKVKTGETQTMLSNGIPPEIVSRYLNVPLDTVEAVRAGAPIASPELSWSIYTDASKIPEYLSPNNRVIALHTNVNKIPHAEFRVNHGISLIQNTDDVVKEAMLTGSDSAFIQEWSNYFLGDNFRLLRDVTRSKLSLVSNESVRGRFFTSTDMSLRNIEELGPIFTGIGKDIIRMSNVAVDKLLGIGNLKENIISMARDDVARVEHNTALNINAGIKGVRYYRDGQFLVPSTSAATPGLLEPVKYNGVPFQIKTPLVMDIFKAYDQIGQELYAQATTLRKIPGANPISDLGFWVPSFNPNNKFIAYAIDKRTQGTTLLYGKTSEELENAITAFKGLPDITEGTTHDIIRHGIEQKLYNAINGRHDPMFMTSANTATLHGGSSMGARIDTSVGPITDIVQAYEHQLSYNVKSLTELMMSDVFDYLKTGSSFNQAATSNQPLGKIGSILNQPKDAATEVMNTLLGKSGLNQNLLWQGVNTAYSAVAEKALQTIASAIEPIVNTVKGNIGKGQSYSDLKYEELVKTLKKNGIPLPFENFSEYEAKHFFHADRTLSTQPLTPRLTVLANTLAATVLLKVGELGQAFVNAISLPILLTSEISSKLPAEYMGAVKNDAEFGAIKTMINGWRYAHADAFKPYAAYGVNKGLFKGVVSEADELFKQTRSIEGGAISKIEGLVDNKIVQWSGKATDFSEQFVREKAFSTGVYIAKEAYPGLPEAGVITFARDFMDRTIGNYTAAQRPTMFQGTLGTAMGLFQTYMVSIAQSMYRHIENKEFKALAKTMLMQNTIFGSRSLPGFNSVSEMIGEHFSDRNVDPTTGLFRALPDPVAQTILYGMVSSFGPSVTTRGDIQPRLPDPTKGLSIIPAISLTDQAYQAMKHVAKAVFTADENAGRGLMEALSMQSISRPVARISELMGGYATTSKGNIVSTPDEIYTWQSWLARGLSVRPIAEARIRDALHLDSVYGTADRKNRDEIIQRLRTHMRTGELDGEVLSHLQEQYMRTGSPQGWNSVVNTAIAQTSLPINDTIRKYLSPNSPTQMMVNNMY